jgi:hypothetical protein
LELLPSIGAGSLLNEKGKTMVRTRRKKKRREKLSAKTRAETHKTGFERTQFEVGNDVPFFRLDRAGSKRIDIIPFEVKANHPEVKVGRIDEGDLYFERTYFVHRGIGANNDSFVCPAKEEGKRCPVCEYRAKLRKDPDADEDLVQQLAPKERQLWNVIDKEEQEKGVQVWDISFHLFGKLLDAEVRNADEDEDYQYYADLESGSTLKLGVAEKSFAKRTFYEVETIGFKPRREPYAEDILEQTHSLDDILKVLEYDKLKSIFMQTTDDEDEDEDEPEEKPKSRS